jgi:hypothetical protein
VIFVEAFTWSQPYLCLCLEAPLIPLANLHSACPPL